MWRRGVAHAQPRAVGQSAHGGVRRMRARHLILTHFSQVHERRCVCRVRDRG
jgi:hypothetical protein